ncbi:MAG: hypothetical protein ACJA0N_002571, partial [Pseudohongiellaceae bacterium]
MHRSRLKLQLSEDEIGVLMKRSMLGCLSAAIVGFSASLVNAADELIIQVNDQQGDLSSITAKVDGGEAKPVNQIGVASFDLNGGAHSVQLLRNGEKVHSFRFDTASGQLTDINAVLQGGKPKISVESYFKNETGIQKKKAVKGALSGVVKSASMPVAGAIVEAMGTNYTTTSDEDGEYRLELPRGIYKINISHPDFGSRKVNNYRVISNMTKGSNFSISSLSGGPRTIEEVVVLGKISASMFEDNERYSSNVVDTIGVEQLARFGDSDVAASVVRVPSVTVQDNQYVFIRGLGGRYITTSLNGATMPSTNPNKRTVPLDLFPSNIVEQLSVRKTFVASMPGESTGGNLVINTRSLSEEGVGKLSLSMGFVDGLTGESVNVDPHNGDFDALGWDDGSRDVPGVIAAVVDTLEYSDYLSTAVEQELGRIAALELIDNWDLKTETTNPDISLGVNYGDIFYIDSADAELSVFGAANYKNEWNKQDNGVSRTYGGENDAEVEDDFKFKKVSNDIDVSGLLSLGLNIGDDTYQANTIVSRVTQESVRTIEGYDGDASVDSIRWKIQWEEREFISQQLRGQHVFGDDEEISADWQFTLSRATRDSPDRREIRFDLKGTDGIYNLQVPNLTRRFDELTDDNFDFSSNVEYLIVSDSDVESTFSAGLQAIKRERDSDSNTYGFNGGLTSVDDNSSNLLVSDVITTDNITGNASTGFTFQDKTLPSDGYEAEMNLNGFYVSYDALINSEYQVVLGARYEDFEMITNTFELQGEQRAIRIVTDEDIVLPSISFNWFYEEDQQLRLAISQTVSRPDFREKSNATYYDDECDCRVQGNLFLEISEVTNVDVRWEKYWSADESLSLALFYKDFNDPIERVALPASGTAGNSRTFQNSESAEIYGIEFDGRKVFSLDDSFNQSVFVSV